MLRRTVLDGVIPTKEPATSFRLQITRCFRAALEEQRDSRGYACDKSEGTSELASTFAEKPPIVQREKTPKAPMREQLMHATRA